MRLVPATPARLARFASCALAYRMTYLDRPAPARGPAWAHTTLGAAVHTALRGYWDLPAAGRRPDAGRGLLAGAWSGQGFRRPGASRPLA
jgi:putative RecB family exonuclease